MTRGFRHFSIVDPVVSDDDRVTASKGDKNDDDKKSTSSAPQTHGISAAAQKTLSSQSTNSSTSTSSSSNSTSTIPSHSNSTSSVVKPVSNTTAPSTSKPLSSSTTKLASKTSKSASAKNATQAPAKPTATDPGEHKPKFQKALPPSYNYKDDDENFPDITKDSPLNPVVDDISQFLDDTVYPTNGTRSILPPETEPPSHWPLDVFGIFVGASIVLFVATAYKNYKKRQNYIAVSSN